MRTLLYFALLGLACVVLFLFLRPEEENDRKAIEDLFHAYYDALRDGKYEEAASYYETGSEDVVGGDLAGKLRMASNFRREVPGETRLSSLRIAGNQATGEVVIPDEEDTFRYVEEDEDGNVLGTWARSIHFVKINGEWRISQSGENVVGIDLQQALDVLQNLPDRSNHGVE